jgi:hypothetical protein
MPQAAQSGARDIQHKAVSYAERNIAASFDFAHKLLQAQDPEEVIRLHTEHMKTQIENLTAQASELGRTATVTPRKSSH